MTKAQELREIRNQILYKGNPPLEFGCEVQYLKTDKFHKKDDIETLFWNSRKDSKYIIDSCKILGKPVTLQNIMLMIEKTVKMGDMYFVKGSGELFGYMKNGDIFDICLLDLTKEIEKQDDEVLDNIIKLIK